MAHEIEIPKSYSPYQPPLYIVCYCKQCRTMFMEPDTADADTGWDVEYTTLFLGSDFIAHCPVCKKKTKFVCVKLARGEVK